MWIILNVLFHQTAFHKHFSVVCLRFSHDRGPFGASDIGQHSSRVIRCVPSCVHHWLHLRLRTLTFFAHSHFCGRFVGIYARHVLSGDLFGASGHRAGVIDIPAGGCRGAQRRALEFFQVLVRDSMPARVRLDVD